MLRYEKINPPSNPKDSDKLCFDCSYKYPLSNFTHDRSGFFVISAQIATVIIHLVLERLSSEHARKPQT